jgi:thiol-disulfide isomerase/thioredoxin
MMDSLLRNRAALVIVALIVAIFAASHGADAADPAAGANIALYPKPLKISDLVLRSASGRMVSLNEFRGKVVLLHFWSINCPACRVEEPLLHQLKKNFGPAGLEILGVNLVDTPQEIAGYAATHQSPFPLLFDGGQGFRLQMVSMAGKNTAFLVNPSKEAILEVPGFPTTYILDCRGSAIGYSVGAARWDDRAAVVLIRNLVSEAKTCKPLISFGNAREGSLW